MPKPEDTMSATQSFSMLVIILCPLIGQQRLAIAQETSDKAVHPSIRVSGDATVTAKPDQAEINIGVVTEAQTAQAAANQNAQKQDAVISQLRKTLGSTAE